MSSSRLLAVVFPPPSFLAGENTVLSCYRRLRGATFWLHLVSANCHHSRHGRRRTPPRTRHFLRAAWTYRVALRGNISSSLALVRVMFLQRRRAHPGNVSFLYLTMAGFSACAIGGGISRGRRACLFSAGAAAVHYYRASRVVVVSNILALLFRMLRLYPAASTGLASAMPLRCRRAGRRAGLRHRCKRSRGAAAPRRCCRRTLPPCLPLPP